jgi:Holliday junction resolvase
MRRVDENQAEIVRALRQIGAKVQSLAELGSGVPDILVGHRGRNYLFEIKSPKQPPSKRKLTPDEVAWHEAWRGQVAIIENFGDALKILSSAS